MKKAKYHLNVYLPYDLVNNWIESRNIENISNRVKLLIENDSIIDEKEKEIIDLQKDLEEEKEALTKQELRVNSLKVKIMELKQEEETQLKLNEEAVELERLKKFKILKRLNIENATNMD